MKRYTGNSISYVAAQPAAALQGEVDFFYQLESSIDELPISSPELHTIFLPLHSVEMIFNYHDTSVRLRNGRNSSQSYGKIIGQHTLQTICSADYITKTNKTFHVRFRPGAYRRLFGMPQVELKSSCLPARDVLGRDAAILENDLNNSDSFEARIKIIETFLLHRRKLSAPSTRQDCADAAVRLIQSRHGNISVRDMRDCLDVSERMLERSFAGSVGLSPREFIRVIRFGRLLAMITLKKDFSWTEHPDLFDYYDDAHFIKEFKAATTFSPGYFRSHLGKKIVKSFNFLVFRDTIAPYQENFFRDCMALEKRNDQLF